MDTIGYKKNIDSVIERLISLYERKACDQIFAGFEIPSKTLDEFREKNPEGFCTYPDPHDRINFWNKFLCEHKDVEDDSVPSAYLSEFDQGLYGGLVGGDAVPLDEIPLGIVPYRHVVPPLFQPSNSGCQVRRIRAHWAACPNRRIPRPSSWPTPIST